MSENALSFSKLALVLEIFLLLFFYNFAGAQSILKHAKL